MALSDQAYAERGGLPLHTGDVEGQFLGAADRVGFGQQGNAFGVGHGLSVRPGHGAVAMSISRQQ